MNTYTKALSGVLAAAMLTAALPFASAAAQTGVNLTGYENETATPLTKIGSYVSGHSNKDGGVAEIVSYDPVKNNAWVVNGTTGMLDILSMTDVTCGVSEEMTATSLDIRALVEEQAEGFAYGDMTSVSISAQQGLVAVALQEEGYDKNGKVAILKTDGTLAALLDAGCQPDMVTFTPDGSKILVANEGEPREGYGDGVVDPAGSVTVITVNGQSPADSQSNTITFDAFDGQRDALVEQGIILAKGAMPSVDFEPEYIACDNNTAYVSMQEANAIAVLDLTEGVFTGVYSMGYKDLSAEENAIDLVEDGAYAPKTYPDAVGAYMPDALALYTVGEETYLFTANEGDAREWGKDETEYVNEEKEDLTASDGSVAEKVRVIDPSVTDGLPEGKSVLFGGRSFSAYRVDAGGLTQVFDSQNDFEEKTQQYIPDYFNCSNDDNEYDSRSAKKGPEPESVTVGTVGDKTYAFVALERIGGIMMYDVTDPGSIVYENYINTRDFSEDPDLADPESDPVVVLQSDFAPEGLCFISSEDSPSSTPILLAAFEVSGTVAAYAVGEEPSLHNLTHVPAKEATAQEEGNTEYWECASCHKLFSDAQAQHEVTREEVTIERLSGDTTGTAGNTGDVTQPTLDGSTGTGDPASSPATGEKTASSTLAALLLLSVGSIMAAMLLHKKRRARR